ncbi:Xaa-Pro peptidase family protein [Venenivibrio stagnispumantis]|uniref:Xaa-Pro aminopeptidase/Xaa-Pro dipeptidase n=1 Tax=Venenivibrio stagnispumantis TaxID=407998 RepID=A0AA46AEK0_9AQUI|nr:Xaa-Pro peptidase family protein [Venenivibrio stagnispumantis]MCW4572880.1 Xaa-Pro peptidase family protein [Venenivibrio stagnispumantis]SMP12945.1 Xaa-Pro aminopeptidase/Xaa-Pro dipeptidase [Venenivibrio stagnispumantis]
MDKLKEIQNKIKENNLDAFLFSSKANVFYLSKFNSSNAFVILTEKDKYFLTDSRYITSAKEKLKDWNVIELGTSEKKPLQHLKEIISQITKKSIGFEKDKITISFYEKLKEGLDRELVGFEGFLNDIRITKTEEEIDIIREAVHKIDNVFKNLIGQIKGLKTELDVRRKIIDLIFEEGGVGESFQSIVATGKHSAIPHWETSDSKIENNQPLLIDMGLIYKGYCSDFTRTIFLGNVSQKIKDIYKVVKEAHLEAVNTVKAGIPIKEIDLKAREIISKYGYGDYYKHSTGHGIGVEIHEEPRIYKDNENILLENTVFTIEPGIYIPEIGGVRLENIVVARKTGAEILTKTPLDEIIL